MANFEKPTAGWLDGWDEDNFKVTVQLGKYVSVWLRGGGPNGEKLDVALTPQNPQLVKIKPPVNSGTLPNVQWLDIEGVIMGQAQLDAFWVKDRATRIPYAKPLQIEVTSKLAAYTVPGITVRLKSNTLGAITNLSIWERSFIMTSPDAEEVAHSVWDLPAKANLISQRFQKPFLRLDIWAHGSDASFTIGQDNVTPGSLPNYASAFNSLEQYFEEGSFVRIVGCGCGGNREFLHRLAGMMGVTVWGGIGDMNTGAISDSGKYASCDPDGTYVVSTTFREY
jgi:hypothetical protein